MVAAPSFHNAADIISIPSDFIVRNIACTLQEHQRPGDSRSKANRLANVSLLRLTESYHRVGSLLRRRESVLVTTAGVSLIASTAASLHDFLVHALLFR
jgi:hypothetical protein